MIVEKTEKHDGPGSKSRGRRVSGGGRHPWIAGARSM